MAFSAIESVANIRRVNVIDGDSSRWVTYGMIRSELDTTNVPAIGDALDGASKSAATTHICSDVRPVGKNTGGVMLRVTWTRPRFITAV